MARVRVRQHVNPLSYKYRYPIDPPDWNQVYQDLTQPIHLDIGCARGRFLLQMAQLFPEINFLGIEIREALVIEANQECDHLGLNNLAFLFGNMNIYPEILLQSLPLNKLFWASIQFPDPWFKQRHSKRRVVQPELVKVLAKYMAKEGMVFLQSDVESIAIEITEKFQENPDFVQQHSTFWLEKNIFPVATEREKSTYNKGQSVYRSLFKVK